MQVIRIQDRHPTGQPVQNNLFFSARLLGFAGLLPQLVCLAAAFDDGTRYMALSRRFSTLP